MGVAKYATGSNTFQMVILWRFLQPSFCLHVERTMPQCLLLLYLVRRWIDTNLFLSHESNSTLLL